MSWKYVTDIPLPINEWVFMYCMTEREQGEGNFAFYKKDEPNIFVAKINEYGFFIVLSNTCGCCYRKIKPVVWMEIPDVAELICEDNFT